VGVSSEDGATFQEECVVLTPGNPASILFSKTFSSPQSSLNQGALLGPLHAGREYR